MFSLLLSSEEDFPMPIDSSDLDTMAGSRISVLGTPPTSQTPQTSLTSSLPSHSSAPQPPPPTAPSLPLPPPSTSVPCTALAAARAGVTSELPNSPLFPTSVAANPQTSLKRCDDDVQFVSEKPVKRRRLDSPAAPTPASTLQQQRPPSPHARSLSSQQAAPAGQTGSEGSGPLPCITTRVSTVVSENALESDGAGATHRVASLPSLERYVFPTGPSSSPSVCRKDSPQLSPKQALESVPQYPQQKGGSQPAVSTRDEIHGNTGEIGTETISEHPGDKTTLSLAQPTQPLCDGDVGLARSETNALATQHLPPGLSEPTAPAVGPEMVSSAFLPENGIPATNTSFQHPPTSQEAVCKGPNETTTSLPMVLPPGDPPRTKPLSPTTTYPPGSLTAAHNVAHSTSPINQQSTTTVQLLPPSGHSSPVHAESKLSKGEGYNPPPPPPAPKPEAPQAVAPVVSINTQTPRQIAQFQNQAPAQLSPRSQSQIRTQGHGQAPPQVGLHGPGLKRPKAHCQICAARRQQAALQQAALGANGKTAFPQGTLPPGTGSSHAPMQAPNGAGYNVVYVPTPMQGSNFPVGVQFNSHPNQSNHNVTTGMGLPSQQYILQNPAQGKIVARPPPVQTSQTTAPTLMGQTEPPRSETRVSPQQGVAPRKLAHQEHSPGKHIIVDIADTAMEAFPFAKVAQRHNTTVDRVRNIFEAVVAMPLLRVPADKRRAGKLGQDRVKSYLVAKKDLDRQRAAKGREGRPSVYEMAKAMGPDAHGHLVYGSRGPW